LLIAKLLTLTGAYAYVALGHLDPLHGSMWMMVSSLAFFAVANALLFLKVDLGPEGQEKLLLISLGLDALAASYLFLLHPPLRLGMLMSLTLICGLYNYLLPTGSGVMVASCAILVHVFGLFLGPLYAEAGVPAPTDTVALLILGVGTICSAALLTRRLRRAVDRVYTTADTLTLDLSAQVVESSLNIDELKQRNKEIQTMLGITENLVSVLEWEDLFKRIVEAFRNRFNFDKFCIYLYEPEHDRLELSIESGERATGVAKHLKSTQGVVGWCYTHGKGVAINNVTLDDRYTQFNERGKRIRSLICEPLIFRGNRLGVVCLDSERVGMFNENALTFLERLAPLISIAVANSLSFREVKAASNTDNLTGLANHRGFMEKFLPLLDDSFCDGFPLAILTLDIDGFKSVNDTYGHLIGNLVLTELSAILDSFFRASDLAARFGGEEFVVVLNGTPPDTAPRIAEQLRRKVESHQFPITMERDTFRQVTVSIGLATTLDTNLEPQIVSGSRGRGDRDKYLKNAEEIWKAVIDNADQAMYAAKRSGKNQVMLSHFYPIHMEGVKVILSPDAMPTVVPQAPPPQPIVMNALKPDLKAPPADAVA
jgi:diguanylate cyclase (GGDEF)-like protein